MALSFSDNSEIRRQPALAPLSGHAGTRLVSRAEKGRKCDGFRLLFDESGRTIPSRPYELVSDFTHDRILNTYTPMQNRFAGMNPS